MQERQSRTHSPHIFPHNRWHINVRASSRYPLQIIIIRHRRRRSRRCSCCSTIHIHMQCHRIENLFILLLSIHSCRRIQYNSHHNIYHWRRMLTQWKRSGIVWSIHSMTIFMRSGCVSLHCVSSNLFTFPFFIFPNCTEFPWLSFTTNYIFGGCMRRKAAFFVFEPFCLRIHVSISSMLGFVYVRFGIVYRSSIQE